MASDARGPQARITRGSPGIAVTSSSWTWMPGRDRTASVTRRPNSSRSTASAFPAGTREVSAMGSRADPRIRSSSLRRPFPDVSSPEPRELLHTSSANRPDRCAGVSFAGRISYRSTSTSARDRRRAASEPARPAPTIVTERSAIAVPLPVPCRRRREEHREGAPFAGSLANLDEPLVLVNDLLRDGETEPCPPLLGREERVEDLFEDLRGDPGPGVDHRRDDVPGPVPDLFKAVDHHLSPRRNGVHRVADEVPHHLLQLLAVPLHHERLQRSELDRHSFLPGLARADRPGDVPEQHRHVEAHRVPWRRAGVGQEVGDEAVQPLAFPPDDVEEGRRFAGGGGRFPEQLGRSGDRREGIPDLVRETRGELPHPRQAIRDPDALLHLPDGGQVLEDHNAAGRVSLRVLHRGGREPEKDLRAVGPQKPDLRARNPGIVTSFSRIPPFYPGEDLAHRLPDRILPRPPENGARRVVHQVHPSLRVDREEA